MFALENEMSLQSEIGFEFKMDIDIYNEWLATSTRGKSLLESWVTTFLLD